jgi:hypothetical protein
VALVVSGELSQQVGQGGPLLGQQLAADAFPCWVSRTKVA